MVMGIWCEKKTLTKPFIEFIFFKVSFLFFVRKNGPINVESHMYKVTTYLKWNTLWICFVPGVKILIQNMILCM